MLNWKDPGRHPRRMQESLNLIFSHHPSLLEFLFEKDRAKLCAEPEWLLDSTGEFSEGEQILIRVALELWSGIGGVRLWDSIERLDEGKAKSVLIGLRHLRRTEMDEAPMVWRQPKRAYLKSGIAFDS